MKQHYSRSVNKKSGNYFLFISGLQVLISQAETKDGSGGPLEYEDLEDLVFPRDPVEVEKTLRGPTEHQYIIMVRLWNNSCSVFVKALLDSRL